jgi:hypothetical protein
MKTSFLMSVLLVSQTFGQPILSTNGVATATNALAIYLVDGNVPRELLVNGRATAEGVKLVAQPILSDPDFVGWDVNNHTFLITPAAAIRVGVECEFSTRPFVLMAEGVPVYLGAFWTSVSSTSCSVPVINADLALDHCFMGGKNIPEDVNRLLAVRDAAALERLTALAKSSPTTNVVLRIEPGYVIRSPEAEKRLGDPRVAAAVQKVFRVRKQ